MEINGELVSLITTLSASYLSIQQCQIEWLFLGMDSWMAAAFSDLNRRIVIDISYPTLTVLGIEYLLTKTHSKREMKHDRYSSCEILFYQKRWFGGG